MDYSLLKKYTRDMHILFVEDDNDFRKEFHELLLDIFPKVSVAVDGLDALNKYKQHFMETKSYFDIIISDIKMPNADGIDLVKSIYEINKDQLVIILSARNEFKYLLPLVNLGIHQFFTKPIDYSTFLDDIFKLCSQIYLDKKNNNTDIINLTQSLIWDKNKKKLIEDGKIVELTKNEIRFVETILNNNGRICTTDELINYIWFDDLDLYPDITHLKSLIYRLRKKVPNLHIKNIYGMGYTYESE